MSSNRTNGRSSPNLATLLGAAALSALAGFAAVYVIIARPDNASRPAPATKVQAPAAPARPATDKLNTGDMTAFVYKPALEALPELTFNDADGKALTLAAFKGKTVLLNLWATWCAPCRKEMPALDRLQKALGSDKFEVVALSVDRNGTEAAKKFLAETKVETLRFFIDPTTRATSTLKAVGMPTTILIDKEGREIGRLVGPAEWDSADAKRLIEAALR